MSFPFNTAPPAIQPPAAHPPAARPTVRPDGLAVPAPRWWGWCSPSTYPHVIRRRSWWRNN